MFREKLLILWSQIRRNLLAWGFAGVGLVLIIIGFIWVIVSPKENSINFESSKDSSPSASMFIDVQGAVVHPGVYKLNSDARLQDGLIAAGGLSATADREWVAKNLNLAAKLKDGIKIYVPLAGQGEVSSISTSDLININMASLSSLDKLPGIGPVTGQKIIDNRPYADVNDLLTKKVVGKKVFEQIKEKITVY